METREPLPEKTRIRDFYDTVVLSSLATFLSLLCMIVLSLVGVFNRVMCENLLIPTGKIIVICCMVILLCLVNIKRAYNYPFKVREQHGKEEEEYYLFNDTWKSLLLVLIFMCVYMYWEWPTKDTPESRLPCMEVSEEWRMSMLILSGLVFKLLVIVVISLPFRVAEYLHDKKFNNLAHCNTRTDRGWQQFVNKHEEITDMIKKDL
jgi:hypothetical protein